VSAVSKDENGGAGTLTLGELLYADLAITCVPEKDWLALVRAIAAGDESALRVLFEKTYPFVFTYLMRLTGDRRRTEDLILDVFQDVWCEAPVFDGASGPVLGWIMRQARSGALTQAARGETLRRSSDGVVAGLLNDSAHAHAGDHRTQADLRLQVALETLAPQERQAIEAAFLHGLSYPEVAAQCGGSTGTIKRLIHSGLSKLRDALQEQGDES
jgi:RNA polymerase sigma-70 factor (ECF subfamily)